MRFLRGRRSLLMLVADVLAICAAGVYLVALAPDGSAASSASPVAAVATLQSAPMHLADVSQGSGLSTQGVEPAISDSGPTATPIGGVTLTHGGRSEEAEVSRGSGLGMRGPGPSVPTGALPVLRLFTATSRTYKAPEGTYLTTIYSQPVNSMGTDGVWRPIEGASAPGAATGRPNGPSIDASVSREASQDCPLASNSPTTSLCASTSDTVGWDGTNTDNSLVQFDVKGALPSDASVLNAQLGMYLWQTSTSNSVSVSAYAASRPWTTAATWNAYDGTNAWTMPGGDFTTTHTVANPSVIGAPGWAHWYPTQIVQEWANGTLKNEGLVLADSTQGQTNDMLSFYSSKASSNRPYMSISWVPRGQQDSGAYTMQPFSIDGQSTMKVNLASGDLFVTSNDLSVNGTGVPAVIEHNYDSLNTEGGSVNPWTSLPSAGIYLDGSVAISLNHYDYPVFIRQSDGSFLTPPGIDATLCKVNGSTCTANKADTNGATYALTFNHGGAGPLYQAGNKFTFSETGGPLSDADRYGNAIVYHWGTNGLSSITDTQGRTFTRQFHELSGGFHATAAWLDNTGGREVKYAYGSNEKLETYTDAEGRQTKYAYNEQGELKEIVDPLKNVTKLGYDSSRRVTQITQPEVNGSHPTWQYGYYIGSDTAHGHVCDAELGVTKKTVVTDPNSHQTTFCANAIDEAIQTFDALGNERDTEYTPSANVASFQAPGASGLANISYDGNNNATSFSDASKLKETFSYGDTAHPFQATQAVDAAGSTMNYCYAGQTPSPKGCPSGSGQPNGSLTAVMDKAETRLYEYTHNTNGTTATATDQLGNKTTYEYDSKGNLTKKIPPVVTPLAVKSTSYTPDSLSRLSSVTDGNGNTTKFTYDKLDRDHIVTDKDGAKMTYTYDAGSNLLSRVDSAGITKNGTGTTKYKYDALNRLTQETLPGGATNAYAYDPISNLTSLTDPSGTTSYGFNQLNELTSLAEPTGKCEGTQALCSHFSYDNFGNRTTTNLANGDTIENNPDAAGRILSTKATTASKAVLSSFAYEYEGGLVHTMEDKEGDKTTYTYDGLDRLSEAVETGAHAASWKVGYDAIGNRANLTVNATAVTSYAYNADSEMCWSAAVVSNAACTAPPTGATTYTHDSNGNLTGDSAGNRYTYTDRNQTSSVTVAGNSAWSQSFGGYGQGELTASGTRTFQNNRLGVGIQHGGESGDVEFVHEPDGQPFSTVEAGSRHYYLFDALGSVVGLANTTGERGGLDAYITYDPFGNPTETGKAAQNYLWFGGGYPVGSASGSAPQGPLHFGERFYAAASTGTWTQPDPANPGSAATYRYAADNPVNATDPSGAWCFSLGALSFGCNGEGVSVKFGFGRVNVEVHGPDGLEQAIQRCGFGVAAAGGTSLTVNALVHEPLKFRSAFYAGAIGCVVELLR
jgi:RHS repeat-associated protein